jgi:hypothetical protein
MQERVVSLEALKEFLSEFLICEFNDEQTLKITWSEVGESSFNEGINTLHAYMTVHGWTAKVKCQTYFKPERSSQENKSLRDFGMEEIDEDNKQYLVLKVKLDEVDEERLSFLLGGFFDEAAEMQ